MTAAEQKKSLWPLMLVAAGLLIFLIVAVAMVRVPPPPGPKKPVATPPSIVLTQDSQDPLLREKALLLDPTPLFLPTSLNASQPQLPSEIQREPGAVFQSFSAKLTFAVDNLSLTLPEPVSVPARPVESLRVGQTPNPFTGLGKVDRIQGRLPERLAFLEVLQAGTGQTVLASSLKVVADFLPPALVLSGGDWRPLECVVAIDAMGRVGQPALIVGSGHEDVDGYFRDFLAKSFRLDARLAPGIYVLRVGP